MLLAAGTASLALALVPAWKICRLESRHRRAWRWLGALILLFLPGYLSYLITLFRSAPGVNDLLVSIILAGGGFFVILVVRLSLRTLETIREIADTERHRALHDELTGLPNRLLLYERIDHAMRQARRNNEPITIMLMDLNRFKEINDTLGHFYGDYLLQMIAPRLWKSVRNSDTIARFGGDEFAVVLPGVDLEQAINISEKISRSMEEPFQVEGSRLSIDVSIGIAVYPEDGRDSDTLLQRADVALYGAKKAGNTNFAVYSADHDEHSMERLLLTVELREAIQKEQILIHYQPKYSIRDRKVCGVEALARWARPGHEGLVMPDVFIPVAERTGLIREMTYLVFGEVFAQISRWREHDLRLPVSVNLSTKLLHDLDLPGKISELIDTWRIDPSLVILEITESSMMAEPELAFRIIQNLSDMGMRFAIDDFGTGYSSLALLKRLPGCELKIDKSFVTDMATDVNDLAIVRTSLSLARNMNLSTVAEGVETREALDKLVELDCEMVQGYFLSRPLPPEQIIAKIEELNDLSFSR